MDLAGHGEACIVHPLKLVISRETMHKHRLPIHSDSVCQARRRAGIGRVRSDSGECSRQEHRRYYECEWIPS